MLMPDLALTQRLEFHEAWSSRAHARVQARLYPETGATSLPFAGGHAVYCGRSPFTQVYGAGLSGPVRAADLDAVEAAMRDETRVLYAESIANPTLRVADIPELAKIAHRHGARVVVDGVAYAPHRVMDVAAWDVDWYAYSAYKVYGPHMAALYGKSDAFADLVGPNHYFVDRSDVPYKFELGGVNHEGCAGLIALGDYLKFLAGADHEAAIDRETVCAAFGTMTDCELPLQAKLIAYLLAKDPVALIGPKSGDRSRVGTISFVHSSLTSREVAEAAHEQNIGIRHGHMYAHRLCKAILKDPDDGVVRISLVHYNSLEEIDRLIDLFERIL